MKNKTIQRDISWLSFNARVLQEAADKSVPLRERVKFLGIFSNNLDEFFRVRVATLRRMREFGASLKNMHLEDDPGKILDDIQQIVLHQQSVFDEIWEEVKLEMEKEKIFLITETGLSAKQKSFVEEYFEEEARASIIPIMIESLAQFPYLRDKSIYLGVVMWVKQDVVKRKYAIIEVPAAALGRFIELPSPDNEHHIMLLEDLIKYNLPKIFGYFGYNNYNAWVFKVTKDAEMDIDNDIATSLIQKVEKGLKNRRKGKPVRFTYDKEMDAGLLDFLIRKLHLSRHDSFIPGSKIHNFRHFMDFPNVFKSKLSRKKPFTHPALKNAIRVTDVIQKQDVLLSFPYHSFASLLDLLREAAIDPDVTEIKMTAYRLASNSKVINTLINAKRNGKKVTVVLELRARFDEEANLLWKLKLEEEGIKVLVGIPNYKIHSKLGLIRKRVNKKTIHYGFISTGNFHEKTAKTYGDHCLLTSNRALMADVNRMFTHIENYKGSFSIFKGYTSIIPCPVSLRKYLEQLINKEIANAKAGKKAVIVLKMNSLSDTSLIHQLYDAAKAGVEIKLIIRGIFCMLSENKKFKIPVKAVSIVDEYLEHARVFYFYNSGKEKIYISSSDWMVRNLDHRIEVTCPIKDASIKKSLLDILKIQLKDNVKARILNNNLTNEYVNNNFGKIRSQLEIYRYLAGEVSVDDIKNKINKTSPKKTQSLKKNIQNEVGSN